MKDFFRAALSIGLQWAPLERISKLSSSSPSPCVPPPPRPISALLVLASSGLACLAALTTAHWTFTEYFLHRLKNRPLPLPFGHDWRGYHSLVFFGRYCSTIPGHEGEKGEGLPPSLRAKTESSPYRTIIFCSSLPFPKEIF